MRKEAYNITNPVLASFLFAIDTGKHVRTILIALE